MMKPTIGRVVHYTSLGDRDGKYPPAITAAIITAVDPQAGTVSLKALYPTGVFDMPKVEHTEARAGSDLARGKWAWPDRE